MTLCPKCKSEGLLSQFYPNTYYCETDKEYYGELAEAANKPMLMGGN